MYYTVCEDTPPNTPKIKERIQRLTDDMEQLSL